MYVKYASFLKPLSDAAHFKRGWLERYLVFRAFETKQHLTQTNAVYVKYASFWVSHNQKIAYSTRFYSCPSDSIGHRWKNIFEAYLSFRWKHFIGLRWNAILGPTVKPKHDFLSSLENRSLRWNPLDSIHVHRNPMGTDGGIHVINLLTSGELNHSHSR